MQQTPKTAAEYQAEMMQLYRRAHPETEVPTAPATEPPTPEIRRQLLYIIETLEQDKLGKPVVATTDAHYQDEASAIYRNILMAGQGYKDAENGTGLYLRTTDDSQAPEIERDALVAHRTEEVRTHIESQHIHEQP